MGDFQDIETHEFLVCECLLCELTAEALAQYDLTIWPQFEALALLRGALWIPQCT